MRLTCNLSFSTSASSSPGSQSWKMRTCFSVSMCTRIAISALNLSGNADSTRSSSSAPLRAHVYANHRITYSNKFKFSAVFVSFFFLGRKKFSIFHLARPHARTQAHQQSLANSQLIFVKFHMQNQQKLRLAMTATR